MFQRIALPWLTVAALLAIPALAQEGRIVGTVFDASESVVA